MYHCFDSFLARMGSSSCYRSNMHLTSPYRSSRDLRTGAELTRSSIVVRTWLLPLVLDEVTMPLRGERSSEQPRETNILRSASITFRERRESDTLPQSTVHTLSLTNRRSPCVVNLRSSVLGFANPSIIRLLLCTF
jgi:hypothetical protein